MVNIQNIINTNFIVQKTRAAIGSYKKVLFVGTADTNLEAAKSVFGNCGGDITNITYLKVTSSTIASEILKKKKEVQGTDNDFIFVCFDTALNTTLETKTELIKILEFEAPYKVIPCISMPLNKFYDLSVIKNPFENMGVAVKLYTEEEQVCLSIPAYYSQIRLDYSQSLKDYCYTKEPKEYALPLPIEIDYDTITDIVNFVDNVGGQYVNFGGNLTNGISITAQFGAIACENDIINTVLDLILKKQYLTDEGLATIVTGIENTLQKYVYNGYLMQNAIYTGEDYIENYTTPPTIVIKKGALLPKGYFVSKLPMSSLKIQDKKSKKFPPIDVFLQTQSGARSVQIDGTIID